MGIPIKTPATGEASKDFRHWGDQCRFQTLGDQWRPQRLVEISKTGRDQWRFPRLW